MPVNVDQASIDGFAALARQRGGRYSSMVGNAGAIEGLWAKLASDWPAPRARRPVQPLLAMTGSPWGAADPLVRTATPAMLDALVPAFRAMFTEELGFPPPGPQEGYRAHVAGQIERGNVLARIDSASGEVVFKAELGAACGRWVQVQGVWTNPDYRGQGIAKAGMVTVIEQARHRGLSRVCLYVNDFNAAALAVYQAVGFSQVGTWSTIML
jgi:GNAT superfamily N-acetyltransferase